MIISNLFYLKYFWQYCKFNSNFFYFIFLCSYRFILLNNPEHIEHKVSTLHGFATNTLTNEKLNIELTSDFDPKSKDDNPFSYFLTSIEAAYFWVNGNWVQKNDFSFWAVDVLSLIASVLFVTLLQNMLISFMG